MDNFINLAKQGYQAYESSQGQGNQQQGQQQQQQQQGGQDQDQQYNIQGGSQWNSSDHQNAPSANVNHQEAVQQASAQSGGGNSGLFSEAMSFVNNNQQEHTQPVDEQGVQQAHDQAYNQGNASSLDAGGIGGAAAMQALKMFTSGGGGSSQTQLISTAMSEASSLFDQAGGGTGGDKQTAVNSAAMTVMKLLVQSKFSGMMGGSNSGGLSGLMGMASQFI